MLKKAKEDLSLLMRSGKHIFVFELTYKLAATAIDTGFINCSVCTILQL